MDFSVIPSKTIFIIGIICLILLVIFILFQQSDNRTKVVFCKTGKSFVAYLRVFNRSDILINTGTNKEILFCLSRHMPFFDKKLDIVILTSLEPYAFNGLSYLNGRYIIDHLYVLTDQTTKTDFLLRPYKLKSNVYYLRSGNQLSITKQVMIIVKNCKANKVGLLYQQANKQINFIDKILDIGSKDCQNNIIYPVIFSPVKEKEIGLLVNFSQGVIFSSINKGNHQLTNLNELKEKIVYIN